ncbi:MAG: hypothetical protein EA361_01080 [Bacteroidetes bacterium]|nr:MAG: hypothetical protein EA361_01080 [Bacteroidota bacterium]
MSIAQVKENIIILLENIIKRSENIEKQKGSKSLLEIDLAMEDVRLLYREMDRLRKYTEAEAVNAPLEIKERSIAGIKSENHTPSPTPKEVNAVKEVPQAHSTEKMESPAPDEAQPAPSGSREPSEEQIPVSAPKPAEPAPQPEEPAQPAEEEKPRSVKEEPRAEPKQEVTPQSGNTIPKAAEIKEPAVVTGSEESKHRPAGNTKPISEVAEPKKPVVGESFSSSRSSVHERLAQIKDDKSIGTRMQYKPVTSIKEAIGINEKFLFVNELFNGDLNAYNEAVTQLNSCPSIHEAFELLNKLTIEFQWDGQRSAETIERFADLVQRRHMQ